MTLLTARSTSYLHNLIEKIADHLVLDNLRKISAIVITNPDSLVEEEEIREHNDGDGGGVDKGKWDSHVTLDVDHKTNSISDLG